MQTKVTLVINNPEDREGFEKEVPNLMKLASAIPELYRLESGRVWPKEDGTPTPAHRTLDLYFADYDAASRAVSTPQAGTFFGTLAGTGVPFMALFTELEKN